jgi:isopentenyl phosphate kinase
VVAAELKKTTQPLVIVHGNGTFGKRILLEHRIRSDFLSPEQGQVVLDFNRQSERLNDLLLNVFNEVELKAAPMALSSTMLRCENGNVSLADISPIQALVSAGVTPVIHGGIFNDVFRGFYACSGDKVMSELSKLLEPNVIIFLSDVDGVYEKYPPLFEIDSPVEIADWTFWQRMPHNYAVGIGEMHDKLEQALISAAFADRCYITNGRVPSNISLILSGKDVGTKVVPRGIDKSLSLDKLYNV